MSLGCLLEGLLRSFCKFPVSGLASSPQKTFINYQNTSAEPAQAASHAFIDRFLFLTTDERGRGNGIIAILFQHSPKTFICQIGTPFWPSESTALVRLDICILNTSMNITTKYNI